MIRLLCFALFAAAWVASQAVAAPPIYQLRAVQDLVGMRAGGDLDVRIEAQAPKDAKAIAAEATSAWTLVIAPCAALDTAGARVVTHQARDGRFYMTTPAPRSPRDPYVCVARWQDGVVLDDPVRLRFCVGGLSLRQCHPGWWETHCKGLPSAECDRRAIAAGVKASSEPTGLIYVDVGARSRKVPMTGGSGCPVSAAPWGVVFARRGELMKLDIARRRAKAVMKPPEGALYRSPWPGSRGGMLMVAESATGRRLVHAPPECAASGPCAVETIRELPSAVGRIVGVSAAGDAVLMTHRLSRHAVRVPLDPARPAEQLSIAAPLGDCAVEVDGVRVRNDGVMRLQGR